MIFLKETSGGIRLSVHIQPKASRTAIVGLHGDALKIAVQAPPSDGAANAALSEFLAELFEVPKRSVEIVMGASSRKKVVEIRGATKAAAEAKLKVFL